MPWQPLPRLGTGRVTAVNDLDANYLSAWFLAQHHLSSCRRLIAKCATLACALVFCLVVCELFNIENESKPNTNSESRP